MRTLAVAVLNVLLLSSAATAQPTLSLIWTATTGTGVIGGSVIDAEIGDTLELDVVVTIDVQGFSGAFWDLIGSAGLTASANSLVSGSTA